MILFLAGKRNPSGVRSQGIFADKQSGFADLLIEAAVLIGIDHVEAATEDGDSPAGCGKGTGVGLGIDAERHAGYDGERVSKSSQPVNGSPPAIGR